MLPSFRVSNNSLGAHPSVLFRLWSQTQEAPKLETTKTVQINRSFTDDLQILKLKLSPNSSYIADISLIVEDIASKAIDAYAGIMVIQYTDSIAIKNPASMVSSPRFQWKVDKSEVILIYDGDETTNYTCNGRIVLTSTGDLTHTIV